MTYDAMLAMAMAGPPDPETGKRVCYAKLTTIVNHGSLGRSQTIANITALLERGWIEPKDKRERWRNGRWTNNQWLVLDHEEYERRARLPRLSKVYERCPPFRYDPEDGTKLGIVDSKAKDFPANMELRRWANANREWLQELGKTLTTLTPEQRAEYFAVAVPDDGPQPLSPSEVRRRLKPFAK